MTVAEVYKVAPAPPQAPKANPRFYTTLLEGAGAVDDITADPGGEKRRV